MAEDHSRPHPYSACFSGKFIGSGAGAACDPRARRLDRKFAASGIPHRAAYSPPTRCEKNSPRCGRLLGRKLKKEREDKRHSQGAIASMKIQRNVLGSAADDWPRRQCCPTPCISPTEDMGKGVECGQPFRSCDATILSGALPVSTH